MFDFICIRYIVSDCDSVGVMYDTQHFTVTPEESAAATIKAGSVSVFKILLRP